MTTLIQNGTIVTAERTFPSDLLIENEKIRQMAPGLPAANADRVIEARGMLLLPGGVDAHTHLDMPFVEGTPTLRPISKSLWASVPVRPIPHRCC